MWSWLAESICSPYDIARGTFYSCMIVSLLSGMWMGWFLTYSHLKPHIPPHS
jgi:hypothetical protein